jgi:Sulfotransferase family
MTDMGQGGRRVTIWPPRPSAKERRQYGDRGLDTTTLFLDEPVFILTCARSGSTLLRAILDSHDDLACPSETNVAMICAHLWDTWMLLDPECSPSALTAEARLQIRSSVNAIYRPYLTRRGKTRWCDKSLGSDIAVGKLAQIYENAKFICLYRHAMDMINSGLEATPFGLQGFGFESYGDSPNSVAALAGYWTDHTRTILEFEESHPSVCFRVYYEQLVMEPERVADDIFRFIGVPPSRGITRQALTRRDEPGQFEFGDHKIYAAKAITDASVGRGMRLPPILIAPDQRSAMNQVLTQLGYTAVDRVWEMSTVPPVLLAPRPRQPSAADASADEEPHCSGTSDAGGACGHPDENPDEEARMLGFHELDCELKCRIGQNLKTLPEALARWNTMAIIAYSLKQSRIAVAWRFDRERGEADSDIDDVDFQSLDVEWAFTGEIDSWRLVLAGTENLASSVVRGSVRLLTRDLAAGTPSQMGMAQAANRAIPALAHVLGFGPSPEYRD